MVTWGNNTVHNLPTTPAPAGTAAPAFGAPAAPPGGSIFGTPSAAAPTSLFGSAPTPAFGAAPAPAPSMFGAPSPAGGSSLFGNPAPAAGSSLFGAAPSSSSLFGAKAPAPFGSLIGGPAPGAFGAQPQQPQQPQIPVQAALHAHMEAMNRAETEKIKAELSKLYATYSGTVTPSTSSDAKKNFVSMVYNDLTQEQRQLQWLHGIGAGGKIMPIAPPRPPQVSEEDWNLAVVQNPDPMSYMPVPLLGADSLNARVSWQQDRANQLAKDAELIKASHETVKELFAQGQKRLEDIKRAHAIHRKRLLNVMRKVEVVRCMNQPLQPDEVGVAGRLREVDHQVRYARQVLVELEAQSRSARPRQQAAAAVTRDISVPDRERLADILKGHREEITQVSTTMNQDLRDVELMKERVIPQLGGPPPSNR